MPEATLNAVTGHGQIPDDSIHGTYHQSQAVLDELAALGIGYDNVVQTLEDQGVSAPPFDGGQPAPLTTVGSSGLSMPRC